MVHEIAYSILYNHFYNHGETILNEIGFKLDNTKSRPKNIYYARFIMLIANHVTPTMIIDHPENQLTCWIQNKISFKDLVRINLYEGTELGYPQVIQVYLTTQLSSITSLHSNIDMEGVNVPNPPTQTTKPNKTVKSKSKTTLGVSQKTFVVITTKSQLEGSAHVSKKGEGTGGNKIIHKNKVGESESNHPNHIVSSQQDKVTNKDLNTSLSTSSQEGMDIEKSSQSRAQNIEENTRFKNLTPYARKRKEKNHPGHIGSTHWLTQNFKL